MHDHLTSLIEDFVAAYPSETGAETCWRPPLTAFANAGDERFGRLREAVGPDHALPGDLLPGARTVIAYFIPFDPAVAASNLDGREASREWALAYLETNRPIACLNRFLADRIREMGGEAALIPATHNFDREKLISDWSHRHAAYIAGLGGFGLNNMLITEAGCCGRVGSLITDLVVAPTARRQEESCLHKRNGSCGRCIARCTAGALQNDGFDRRRCYEACLANAERYANLGLADVCGKCVVGLPCSHGDPR